MHTYQRYLEVKKIVDDRTLNRQVISGLKGMLQEGRLRVVELGAGIGTMVARCLEWGLLNEADYTVIDIDPQNIDYARWYLLDWAEGNGIEAFELGADTIVLREGSRDLSVKLVRSDVTDPMVLKGTGEYDLLIAHLFLDLVDVRENLNSFLKLLKPGGIFYLSHIYDGLTTFFPEMDSDKTMLEFYNRSMDERDNDISAYPRSRTGREVLQLLLDMKDIEIIEAGSSDWIVFPRKGVYPKDEREFLLYMVDMIDGALRNVGAIDPDDLKEWIQTRKEQIENGELTFISHQLDVVGKYYD
jgi:SAM-dependent methyltransferase